MLELNHRIVVVNEIPLEKFFIATLSAAHCNPLIKNFYQHLLEKGKLKKVALIACVRKLMI
jgi:hypothetical protein